MMHDTVDVSTHVLGMLNDLGGFDVREFMAPEDDRYATDRMLTEQLEISSSTPSSKSYPKGCPRSPARRASRSFTKVCSRGCGRCVNIPSSAAARSGFPQTPAA